MWKAAIAALALPVSGFVIGKVVGDYFVHANFWMARIGGGTGLLVYVFTLLASYKHLRNFFHTFEPENVKASHTLAIAVEVATFYMSVSAVIMNSIWAFWGGIIGAFVVFWGNFQSMSKVARQHARKAASRRQAPKTGHDGVPTPSPGRKRTRRAPTPFALRPVDKDET